MSGIETLLVGILSLACVDWNVILLALAALLMSPLGDWRPHADHGTVVGALLVPLALFGSPPAASCALNCAAVCLSLLALTELFRGHRVIQHVCALAAALASLNTTIFSGSSALSVALCASAVTTLSISVWLSRSFTVGEAILVAQLYSLSCFAYTQLLTMPFSHSSLVPILIASGLTSMPVSLFCARLALATSTFHTFLAPMVALGAVQSLFLWVLFGPFQLNVFTFTADFFTENPSRIALLALWIVSILITLMAMDRHTTTTAESHHISTRQRKLFHLLITLLFAPSLLLSEFDLPSLAAAAMFPLFLLLDFLRHFNVPPLGVFLQTYFERYRDERDKSGPAIVTHTYLLLACALPIWFRYSFIDSSVLSCWSGLLSIGVGDSMASVVGSRWGKVYWGAERKKTVEGTIANVVSQVVCVVVLSQVSAVSVAETVAMCCACAVSALVEAHTTQIDNLVLPLLVVAVESRLRVVFL